MSAVERIGRVAINTEVANRTNDFVSPCRYLMLHAKSNAVAAAERSKSPSHVVEFVRAAIEPGITTNWGDPLSNVQNLSNAFLNSLVGVSVLDTLLPSMLFLPPRTTIVICNHNVERWQRS